MSRTKASHMKLASGHKIHTVSPPVLQNRVNPALAAIEAERARVRVVNRTSLTRRKRIAAEMARLDLAAALMQWAKADQECLQFLKGAEGQRRKEGGLQ